MQSQKIERVFSDEAIIQTQKLFSDNLGIILN